MRLAPQFRFREGSSFVVLPGHHNHLGSVFETCRYCAREKTLAENEVVCQGLERSVP